MVDDIEKTDADQQADPASQADRTPAPAEAEKPSADEQRWSQATFTKLTQDYAERFKALQEEIAELRASREEKAAPEEENAEDPRVEKAVRSTKAFKELAVQNAKLQKDLSTITELAASSAIASKFPELREDSDQFIAWLNESPGRATALSSGSLSKKAIVAAYRAEHPAKGGGGNGSRPAPKQPAKVEGSSAPAGAARSVEAVFREKTGRKSGRVSTSEIFDLAAQEAKRETNLAEE